MMERKFIGTRKLAIITIIAFIICFFGSIFQGCVIFRVFNVNLIWGDFIWTIVYYLKYGFLYIVLYLSIILFLRKRNAKLLNTILLIQFSVSTIFLLVSAVSGNIIGLYDTINLYLNLLYYAFITIIILGIVLGKKFAYKQIISITIALLIIQLLFWFIDWFGWVIRFYNPFDLVVLILKIIKYVGLYTFTMFIYRYTKYIK